MTFPDDIVELFLQLPVPFIEILQDCLLERTKNSSRV